MQRRAAAIYFVFFLAVGLGAYGYITVVDAQQPDISVDGEVYEKDDVLTVDGQVYVVQNLSGGSGTLAWTNQSAVSTAALANNSTASYQNQSWQVVIENRTDVSEFHLREQLNVTQLLRDDSTVENETVRYRGAPHVVYRANDSLAPLDAFLPDPQTQTFGEGDPYDYTTDEGETVDATVSNVTTAEATLRWSAPAQNTLELTEGANISLQGQQRVVHFPTNESVVLSQNVASYQQDVRAQQYFTERKNGLWAVSILSFATAIVLLGAAYLPVKD